MHGFRSPSGPLGTSVTGGYNKGGYSPVAGQSAGDEAMRSLYARAGAVLQRLRELEAALATQEWWLLARVLPEAQTLSELTSLFAVARGELEDFLARLTGRPASPGRDDESTPGPEVMPQTPQWLHAQRQQAVSILRYAAATLPVLFQEAEALRAAATAVRLAPALIDPLNAVMQRLKDAGESLGGGPGR